MGPFLMQCNLLPLNAGLCQVQVFGPVPQDSTHQSSVWNTLEYNVCFMFLRICLYIKVC